MTLREELNRARHDGVETCFFCDNLIVRDDEDLCPVCNETYAMCPNCGANDPQLVIACAEKIIFYNCRSCDFSTWDKEDYKSGAS